MTDTNKFDLNRFYIIAGNSSAKKSYQMVGYKIENETIDDLLQPNYFEPIKDKLNKDDLILVLDLKKELDYKNVEFLVVLKKSLTEIVIERLDVGGDFSKDLPLPTIEDGNIGISTLLSRSDHQHPKAIATETTKGEVKLATEEEMEKGIDNSIAITPYRLKQKTDKLKEEIDNQIANEVSNLNTRIEEEVEELNTRIDNEVNDLDDKKLDKITFNETLPKAIMKYNTETTYSIGQLCYEAVDGKPILYYSLQDNNLNNNLTNEEYWKELKTGDNENTSENKNISLLKTYYENGNWYRIYDDGWVEQGGTQNNGLVNFFIPFQDTGYVANAIPKRIIDNVGTIDISFSEKTTTNIIFQVRLNGGGADNASYMWTASGKGNQEFINNLLQELSNE